MKTAIKDFLKRFLPVPARTHNAQIQTLSQEIDTIKRKIEESDTNLTAKLKQLSERTEGVSVGHASMLEQLRQVAEILIRQEKITESKYKSLESQYGAIEQKQNLIMQVTENKYGAIEQKQNLIMQVAEKKYGAIEQKQDLIMQVSKNKYEVIEQKQELIKRDITSHGNKISRQIDNFETSFLRVQPQPRLSYFVLNILDHCNLKCKGCDHFAPIAEKRFVTLDAIENDLRQMSRIMNAAVTRIGVMGGEPLLHPDLLEILITARKEFPHTLIELVTNGLLLLSQGDTFWDVCRDYGIMIVTTKYPIQVDYDKIMQIADSKTVMFKFYGKTGETQKTSYKMPMDPEGMQEPKQSFWNCYHGNGCSLLMEGKLYPCTVAPNARHFNKKFNTNMELENGDYLDIYAIDNAEDLLAFLCTPKPFCRYCRTKERSAGHEWERSKQEMSEWT